MDLRKVASDVLSALIEQGFTIQFYETYSTNSMYIKLDYGVSNSIRISDHKGKKGLSYRYNLTTTAKNKHMTTTSEGYSRHFYPMKDYKSLISDVVSERDSKIERYGKPKYREFMEKNRVEGLSKKGFWQQAELVCEGDYIHKEITDLG